MGRTTPARGGDAGLITIRQESWLAVWPEVQPLWTGPHAAEVRPAAFPLQVQPDPTAYAALEAHGTLGCMAVRHGPTLVGYAVAFVFTHPHFTDAPMAEALLYYLLPAYRGQGHGRRLIAALTAWARAAGARCLLMASRVQTPHGAILAHLGFVPLELTYYLPLDRKE